MKSVWGTKDAVQEGWEGKKEEGQKQDTGLAGITGESEAAKRQKKQTTAEAKLTTWVGCGRALVSVQPGQGFNFQHHKIHKKPRDSRLIKHRGVEEQDGTQQDHTGHRRLVTQSPQVPHVTSRWPVGHSNYAVSCGLISHAPTVYFQ